MTNQELWNAVLGELELSLTKANFTTWFNQTFIISIQGGEMMLGVPNDFTKSWLEKKYHRLILNSIQNLCSYPVRSIIYRIESKMKFQSDHQSFENLASNNLKTDPNHDLVSSTNPTILKETSSLPSNITTATVPIIGESSYEFQGLNPRYTFENFIVGKGNELANAAAQAVSQNPGTAYNPLFFYGGVGLGKTHLLHAIGHAIIKKNRSVKVLYVTCERFTNDFIQAVRNGHANKFKEYYRNVSLLLIDDIQFIAGKKETQEEFFHTFNALFNQNGQIVLTSDRPPKAINDLEERLKSRFESGMLTDFSSPDLETRIAILQSKCRERNYLCSEEVLMEIAKTVHSNVRELEGALNKISVHHQLSNTPPSIQSIRALLSGYNTSLNSKFITPQTLLEVVAEYFGLTIIELLGKSREKRLAFPRQIVMYLMREEIKSSFPTIGNELGGRDHTTAMHACDKIRRELEENSKLQQDINHILQSARIR